VHNRKGVDGGDIKRRGKGDRRRGDVGKDEEI
jgi:hypothetical protein